MGEIGKGCQYLKSVLSILKIIEFAVLLIAIGSVGYFLDKLDEDYGKKGNMKFFLFAVVTAWLLVIAFFLTFVSGLHEKLASINWFLTVIVIFSIWSILLLISSAVLTDAAVHYDDKDYCGFLDRNDHKSQCDHLIAGSVCGFLTMVLFIADVIIHFSMYKSHHPTSSTTPSVPTT